ncbi:MAG TPA: SLBB domain-containing protein, partial [Fibrobacteria bacterium]|nr:SLBB domain-containing protein [Fibrobacteria bacterium]
ALPSVAIDLSAALEKGLFGNAVKGGKPIAEMQSEAPDNSIDPDLYRVGGGDGFQIAIKDLPSNEYFPVVNPDGSLYLGDFGEIVLGKVTLTQAKERIREKMRKALKKNYEVYITLKQVKKAVVTVGGSLPVPGTYTLAGTSRLFDALKQANLGQPPPPAKYDLRNVRVRNGDSTRAYDLLRFLATGDPAHNPYVYPGDYIDLAPLDRSVTVAGHVLGPVRGRIPLVPGETLADLLHLLHPRASADTSKLLIHGQGGSREVARSIASGITLRDNDVITVPSVANYGRQDTVLVTGEVVRPGTYAVSWGKTTAAEILELAGGPTHEASPERAFVVRRTKMFRLSMPDPDAQPTQPIAPPRQIHPASGLVRPEIGLSLNELAASNDHALLELGKDPGSMVLEGGDELHVPRSERYVYVSGHVRRPGAYPFSQGASVDEYVDLAGGYSSKADRHNRFLMFAYQDITSLREASEPREGDIIVVPASVEFKRLSGVYLPIFQTVATLLSLTLSIIALNNAR